MSRIPNSAHGSKQDMYVKFEGGVVRGEDELKSCGVRDGSTVQVVRRMRGGGKHKEKQSKAEKKQVASAKRVISQFCVLCFCFLSLFFFKGVVFFWCFCVCVVVLFVVVCVFFCFFFVVLWCCVFVWLFVVVCGFV